MRGISRDLEGLNEEPTLVAEHLGFKHQDTWYFGL